MWEEARVSSLVGNIYQVSVYFRSGFVSSFQDKKVKCNEYFGFEYSDASQQKAVQFET
jgi:hypothetical protein